MLDQLLLLLAPIPAASDADTVAQLLWLLGPIGGAGFFMMVYLRYRNTDKRHVYERETSAEVVDLRTYDQVVDQVRGTRRPRIDGANQASPRDRLGGGTTVSVVEREPAVPPILQPQPEAQPGAQPEAQPGAQSPPVPQEPIAQVPQAPPMPPESPAQPPLPPQSS